MHVSAFAAPARGPRRLSIALIAASAAAYIFFVPEGVRDGGTWVGYTLGGLGTALILWLSYYGMRKRNYRHGRGELKSWLAAHVFLGGFALPVIVTLHTGFQLGPNIHSAAYVLMLVVVASGAWGVYTYLRYPQLADQNRRGLRFAELFDALVALDREALDAVAGMATEAQGVVERAARGTSIGGGVWRQLSGIDPGCPTATALRYVEAMERQSDGAAGVAAHRLRTVLTEKVELLDVARKDVALRARRELWLFIHVPLTFGLLGTLMAHIVSVFWYW